jgi:hypothetical protein
LPSTQVTGEQLRQSKDELSRLSFIHAELGQAIRDNEALVKETQEARAQVQAQGPRYPCRKRTPKE